MFDLIELEEPPALPSAGKVWGNQGVKAGHMQDYPDVSDLLTTAKESWEDEDVDLIASAAKPMVDKAATVPKKAPVPVKKAEKKVIQPAEPVGSERDSTVSAFRKGLLLETFGSSRCFSREIEASESSRGF